MTRATLLATVALLIVPTPALADGGGGKLTTGLVDLGYDYVDFDADSVDQLHGAGSALWTWPGKWNAQANFDFNTFQFDGGGALTDSKFGGGVFWRNPSDYALGGEIHYQTFEGLDGVDLKARGELYLDKFTVGAFVGFGNYDELDGWQLGGYGTYYLERNLGLNVATRYATWDDADVDDWSLDGEVEYLLPDCDTSIYGGLGFGVVDSSSPSSDDDYWHIGGGVRIHFGPDGSLQQRNRAEPLRTVRNHFTF
jgi:hypothetical protein